MRRDWGWAPEYVLAMWKMLQQERPDDYVIATGVTTSLADFVDEAFAVQGLDWRQHVETDSRLFRPTDLTEGRANPQKAAAVLEWRARVDVKETVRRMVEAEGRASLES